MLAFKTSSQVGASEVQPGLELLNQIRENCLLAAFLRISGSPSLSAGDTATFVGERVFMPWEGASLLQPS